jgi:hypothetical protein
MGVRSRVKELSGRLEACLENLNVFAQDDGLSVDVHKTNHMVTLSMQPPMHKEEGTQPHAHAASDDAASEGSACAWVEVSALMPGAARPAPGTQAGAPAIASAAANTLITTGEDPCLTTITPPSP